MKKLISLLIILGLSQGVYADNKVDLGLQMGLWKFESPIIQQAWNKNFYWQGHLGILNDAGWELRGNLGHFSDVSQAPDFLGYNYRVDITPLTGSLLYHFNPGAFLQPYLGAGAGMYFFKIQDDYIGDHNVENKFGFNLTAGAKINIDKNFYVLTEYNRNFLPQNYLNTVFTVGLGFDLNARNEYRQPVTQTPSTYRYTQEEEGVLVEIDQIQSEIKEMKQKRKNLEYEIDQFYENNDFDEKSPEFIKEYRRIKHLEQKVSDLNDQISEAQRNLKDRQNSWQERHAETTTTVEENIVYLHKNYPASPFGLGFSSGYFIYNHNPYRYRFFQERAHRYASPPAPYHATPTPRVQQQPGGPVNPPTAQTPSQSADDRKDFAEKKKDYLKKLHERGLE